jgi:hypothetical protein
MKRLRKPKLEDGELRMYWGREPRDVPEIMLAWQGDSGMKRDANLLHYILCTKKPKVRIDGVDWSQMEPSLIEELHSRGYDLTTLKFSIKKKTVNQEKQ